MYVFQIEELPKKLTPPCRLVYNEYGYVRYPAMLSTTKLQDRDRESSSRQRRRGGFTLTEVMLALGILAIGMSMVAAVFPAALEYNRASNNSTLGTIICENALVLSEMMLTAEIVADSTQLNVYVDDLHLPDATHPYYLTKAQQHYPTGDDPARTGFVMMARRMTATSNTYQVVTVAYRKSDKDNTVALYPVSCSVSGKNVSGADQAYLRIGSPLIDRATGQYAFIESISTDGKSGTLDRSFVSGSINAYVLIERKNDAILPLVDGDGARYRTSPAIGAMSKVTGLRHDLNPTP